MSGLRHALSSLARKPGTWVRIPHKAWIFGRCLFCVYVFMCLARGLVTSWSLVQGVLPTVKRSWNWKSEARAQGDCRASEKYKQCKTETVHSTLWLNIQKWLGHCKKQPLNYSYFHFSQGYCIKSQITSSCIPLNTENIEKFFKQTLQLVNIRVTESFSQKTQHIRLSAIRNVPFSI
jgi:hypothetical protein